MTLIFSVGSALIATAYADTMMRCGGDLIEAGGEPAPSEAQVLAKCGEPSSRHGNNWYYKRPDGSTYRLHFNDNGELESIQEEVR
jgi:hypothetical protein